MRISSPNVKHHVMYGCRQILALTAKFRIFLLKECILNFNPTHFLRNFIAIFLVVIATGLPRKV